jgi:ABC-type Na+ transport system ATPase subunit NatA
MLKNVSFKIPAGAFVGVCGERGAGKTTMFRLLLRLYVVRHTPPLVTSLTTSHHVIPCHITLHHVAPRRTASHRVAPRVTSRHIASLFVSTYPVPIT